MKPIVTLTVNPAIDKNTEVRNVVSERKLRCEKPVRGPGASMSPGPSIVLAGNPPLFTAPADLRGMC